VCRIPRIVKIDREATALFCSLADEFVDLEGMLDSGTHDARVSGLKT
jgi:hypothetical protein